LGKWAVLLGFWRVLGAFPDSFFTKYSQRTPFFGKKTSPESQRTACAGERVRGISLRTACAGERVRGISLRTASAGEGTWEFSLRMARFGVGTAEIRLRMAALGESSTALGERTARFGGGTKSSKRVARGGRRRRLAALAVNKLKLSRRSCFAPGTAQTNFGMWVLGTGTSSRSFIKV